MVDDEEETLKIDLYQASGWYCDGGSFLGF
jgi:hypothetical protein